ncbi:MAG: hypothetical protein QM765_17135 [Myxococcales bacterium]
MPFPGRLALLFLALMLAGTLSGCRNKAKEDLATFTRAEARYRDAKRLVSEGKLVEAGDAYREAQSLLLELRKRAGGFAEGEDPREGEEVAGFAPQQWQERWRQDFQEHLERELPALKAKAAEGTVDREVAHAFLEGIDARLAERWQGEKAEPANGPQLYFVDCSATDEETCQVLFEAITRRLARPTTREKVDPAVRASAWGRVELVGAVRSLAGGDTKTVTSATGLTVLHLPRTLEVFLRITTAGGSNLDGERRLSVLAEPPTKVPEHELQAAYRKQLQVLRESMSKEIDALPKQALP